MSRRLPVNLCGGRYEIAAPIGFLEDAARVEPRLYALLERLMTRRATLAETRAVIDSALRHGGAAIGSGEVLAYEGLGRATALAVEALELALVPRDEIEARHLGNPPAGAEVVTSGSASPSTSASAT